MTSSNEIQLKRLSSFANSRISPAIEAWSVVLNEDSVFQVHSGQTLLESLSLLLLGIEIAYFPGVEAAPLIRQIFKALGKFYDFLMSNFSENWSGEERARFSFVFHQMDRGYHEPFRYVISEAVAPTFATALLLLDDFAKDEPALVYQANQNNMLRAAWEELKIRETTFKWASEFNLNPLSALNPPFWVAGFLRSYEHIAGQLSLFESISGPDGVELRYRVLGLQRWRFDIKNNDTKARFFEVSDSIAAILDLITPAGSNVSPKEDFRRRVKAAADEFSGSSSLVAGRTGAPH